MLLIVINGKLDDVVFLVFEDAISLFDAAERETVGNERGGVYLALCDQLEHLGTVSTNYTTCYDGEVLAIHVG